MVPAPLQAPAAHVTVDSPLAPTPADKPPVGKLHRAPGISVRVATPAPADPTAEPTPKAPPVTLEQLNTYWAEMLQAMRQQEPKFAE